MNDAALNIRPVTLNRIKRYPAGVASGFDDLSADYDDTFGSRRCQAEDRLLAVRLRRFLAGRDGPLLDVGCGTGALLRLISLPMADYTGLDVSAGMIGAAILKYPRAEFVHASVEAMPFPVERFDTVVSIFSALSYTAEPALAMQEIRRVLRPGGRCFLMVNAPRWYRRNAACAGELHVHLAPAAWNTWQAARRCHLAGLTEIRLSAFSILPTPLMGLEGPLSGMFPQAGRYLIIEAARPA